MTNSKSLALVVVSLGGTVTGRTNAGLLADIVRALGGTPTGNTNADLIGQIAAALGGTAGEGTNADRLRAVAEALEVDASGTNAEVLAAILTGLGGSPEAGDTNATLVLGISEHPPGPGPTPTPKYAIRFHVATDSIGYGSVSAASVSDVAEGTSLSATGQAVLVGGVSKCTATPEEDTAEYDYAFVKWTGADDGSTAVPGTVTGDTDLYAHFSRTPVVPEYTAYFHVATDSVGYGSVSVQSVAGVPSGTSVTVAQTVAVGAVGSCSATPEEDTQEWDYAFVGWTGADDASTPAATSIVADTHYYAHFSRTAVGPQPMDPSLFTFTVSEGKATVTGWAGEPPADGYDLVFPETDGQGHPVTGIDGGTNGYVSPFSGAASLWSDSVTSMGEYAFNNCALLATVILPAATSISQGAFYNCTSLTSVSLPAATTIYVDAFNNCTSLTSVSLPAATTFHQGVFSNCTSLTSVSLPAATSIGPNVFEGCTSLTSVSLPAATIIGNSAFYNCTSLTSVSLPAATSVGSASFRKCSHLALIDLPAVDLVDRYAFRECYGVTSVSFGPLTGSLDSDAFYSWTFYDTDGTTVLDKTVASNLANSTFVGTASKLVKQ